MSESEFVSTQIPKFTRSRLPYSRCERRNQIGRWLLKSPGLSSEITPSIRGSKEFRVQIYYHMRIFPLIQLLRKWSGQARWGQRQSAPFLFKYLCFRSHEDRNHWERTFVDTQYVSQFTSTLKHRELQTFCGVDQRETDAQLFVLVAVVAQTITYTWTYS